LSELGTEVFFGVPGVHTLEFFRGIADCGARHVLNRSELGAVHAADGYARTTGRPGVAILISGPGLTSAATAVAQAHHDSVPLLIVSAIGADATQGKGLGALHDMPDQQGLMNTITARSELVDDPSGLPDAFQRAFEDFRRGRPRPIHIQIPIDRLSDPAPPLTVRMPDVSRPGPGRAEIEAALDLLAGAQNPIVLAGGGSVDAGSEVIGFAESLGAPVALTLNAKGVVPDGHELSLSTTLPCTATIEALNDSDLFVAIGTEFSEVDRYYAEADLKPGGKVVRIDIDAGQFHSEIVADAPIRADASAALSALTEGMRGRGNEPLPGGKEHAASIRDAARWWPRAEPLMPLVDAIGAALPSHSMVAVDSTQLGYIGQNAWLATQPRSWMIPAGFGTLGPALPMAIGAAVGDPERPAVCVVGDGGLLYAIGEMATAADLDTGLIMLLYNNQGYGEMRDEFDLLGIPHIGTDAQARDYLAIADGFGWEATRPDDLDAVGEAIENAVANSRPRLIELTPALVE
jgi:thiamine pyrophosphate-dependent acetolactate synthase large subunit-like protein